jgi:hypothetical protein
MRVWLFPLLLLTACADLCERGETLSKTFQERHTECYPKDTLPSPAFDAKACDSSMNACSQKDETALHAYFDCVETLPVCTKNNRLAFNEKYLACSKGMLTVTEGCFRP